MACTRGHRFDVIAADDPADAKAIAVIEVRDVIGARQISAGDRLAIIVPESATLRA